MPKSFKLKEILNSRDLIEKCDVAFKDIEGDIELPRQKEEIVNEFIQAYGFSLKQGEQTTEEDKKLVKGVENMNLKQTVVAAAQRGDKTPPRKTQKAQKANAPTPGRDAPTPGREIFGKIGKADEVKEKPAPMEQRKKMEDDIKMAAKIPLPPDTPDSVLGGGGTRKRRKKRRTKIKRINKNIKKKSRKKKRRKTKKIKINL